MVKNLKFLRFLKRGEFANTSRLFFKLHILSALAISSLSRMLILQILCKYLFFQCFVESSVLDPPFKML